MIWLAILLWWTRNDNIAAQMCIHAAQYMSPANRVQIADYMLNAHIKQNK